MSINYPTLGEGYVPAYQISAIPYVTSSNILLGEIQTYEFSAVTKFLFVKNKDTSSGKTIAVAFTENGLSPSVGNFFTLNKDESYMLDIRTSKLFVSGAVGTSVSYEIIAGLTNIPVKNFLTLTGSNGYSGVG